MSNLLKHRVVIVSRRCSCLSDTGWSGGKFQCRALPSYLCLPLLTGILIPCAEFVFTCTQPFRRCVPNSLGCEAYCHLCFASESPRRPSWIFAEHHRFSSIFHMVDNLNCAYIDFTWFDHLPWLLELSLANYSIHEWFLAATFSADDSALPNLAKASGAASNSAAIFFRHNEASLATGRFLPAAAWQVEFWTSFGASGGQSDIDLPTLYMRYSICFNGLVEGNMYRNAWLKHSPIV